MIKRIAKAKRVAPYLDHYHVCENCHIESAPDECVDDVSDCYDLKYCQECISNPNRFVEEEKEESVESTINTFLAYLASSKFSDENDWIRTWEVEKILKEIRSRI